MKKRRKMKVMKNVMKKRKNRKRRAVVGGWKIRKRLRMVKRKKVLLSFASSSSFLPLFPLVERFVVVCSSSPACPFLPLPFLPPFHSLSLPQTRSSSPFSSSSRSSSFPFCHKQNTKNTHINRLITLYAHAHTCTHAAIGLINAFLTNTYPRAIAKVTSFKLKRRSKTTSTFALPQALSASTSAMPSADNPLSRLSKRQMTIRSIRTCFFRK